MDDEGGRGEAPQQFQVYVLSDSIGETAQSVARAAASQFDGRVSIHRIPYVDDEADIEAALAAVDPRSAVVVYTIVVPGLRAYLQAEAARRSIVAVDVMGPVIDAIGQVSGLRPRLQPGLSHRMDEEYYRRIEAVEFAVKADDGKDPRSLARADVVLVGVSRTSKTPVSMYLAHRGYRVANVPLVPEIQPPRELFALPPERVVGLTIRPELLRLIRRERLKAIGLQEQALYADAERIQEELRYAQTVFQRLGCAVIDVSNRAVEETANKVIEIMGRGER
ncbi:MAG: kinase/pyrophosphorylase [Clostridia bacterium]|nr:kinase/pyrophosphorylase [Clostridia bacterium]